MKKLEKDIREQFRITDRIILIDQQRKEDTLLFLQKEISRKKTVKIYGKKGILIRQFRYMDKSMLGIHAVFCIIALFVMFLQQEEKNILFVSTIISGILGVISILIIGRIFFSGIVELGESCYFNVRQMVAFQMFLSGITNLTVLSVIILFVGIRWKMDLYRIGLYLFVPFLITECCCLMTVLSEVGRKNSCLLMVTGAFAIAFNCILVSMPDLYRMTALTVWGIAFAAGLLLFAVQVGILFRGIEKGEILCMN